jgi:hypothetical protein
MSKAKKTKRQARPVKGSVEKSSLIITLPLTGTTSKIRVKRPIIGFESEAVSCCTNAMQTGDYLEWQIGYDTADIAAPTVVKGASVSKLKNNKKERRHGYELIWLFKHAADLGLITESRRGRLLKLVNEPLVDGIEEMERIQMVLAEPSQNEATKHGFSRHQFHVPSYFKGADSYAIQVKIAPKQRAVGNQAMIYVHLPISHCTTMDGSELSGRVAARNEHVRYEIRDANSLLIDDCIVAFAQASCTHRNDLKKLLALV